MTRVTPMIPVCNRPGKTWISGQPSDSIKIVPASSTEGCFKFYQGRKYQELIIPGVEARGSSG